MSKARDLYVLDTSAWLTLIEDEAGADRIEVLLEQARAGEIVVLVSKKRGQTGIFMGFFVHRKGDRITLGGDVDHRSTVLRLTPSFRWPIYKHRPVGQYDPRRPSFPGCPTRK
jgi:hypothetical protein